MLALGTRSVATLKGKAPLKPVVFQNSVDLLYRRLMTSMVHRHVDRSYQFVVCGAGAGGLAVASILGRRFGPDKLAILDPAEKHYNQPMFTLIGGGLKTVEQACRPMSSVIPPQANWLKTAVTGFIPEQNYILTSDGKKVGYDYLIVALGLQLNFHEIKGLTEALGDPDSLVASNYTPHTAQKTFENIKRFQGGNAIFTFPPMPIKCPGAPQKIMYMADDYWRKSGVRSNATIMYNTALGVIFGVKKYAEGLLKVVERKNIQLNYKHKLIEVNASTKEAIFEVLEEDKTAMFKYDFLHATPPMGPLDFMKGQPISDEGGWVDVNKNTLQHKKYPNIFGIGDCTNVPTSRTAAACAAESAVLKKNLYAVMRGETPTAEYDGYTSCPLITGYGKTILAEFDFDATPLETFPFDQGKERSSMYYLKKDIIPEIYWQGLLKGTWGGPAIARKIMRLGTGR